MPAGVELKADAYYDGSRPDLRSRIPSDARIVLDVGCGRGALGAALKLDRPDARVHGLEYVPEAATVAAERLDDVFVTDLDVVEALPAHWGPFDAVVCGDVLEHLRDPARVLRLLRDALAPGGAIVASIPNIKHWSVLYPLLVQDRFAYEDAGLLDRTHVHFFTLGEIDVMFTACALQVQSVVPVVFAMPPEVATLLSAAVAMGAERAETEARLNAYQYLVVASAA